MPLPERGIFMPKYAHSRLFQPLWAAHNVGRGGGQKGKKWEKVVEKGEKWSKVGN
jgi:hypothetical protein